MADVDLLVQVKTAGISQAVTQMEALTTSSTRTSKSMNELAKATQRGFQAMATAANGASGKLAQPLVQAEAATETLRAGITATEKAYREFATMNIGSTATQRLTAFGGGNLAVGKSNAAEYEAQQIALTANPLRDKIALEQADLQLIEARTRATQAQAGVATASWERQLVAMSPVERAQSILMRSTQELAVATRLMNLANNAVANNANTANYDRQAQAAIRLQAALRGLVVSQQELATAQESTAFGAGNDHQNAFMSSFSYFIIAGMASKAAQAIGGVGLASVQTAAQMERSFVDVHRTFEGTDSQLSALRIKLLQLSTSTPISFIDLSQIAAMGNQLGIAAEDIQSFTQTVSQYSAISGQSADDAATAFGRISNLTGLAASQYSNLASAIEYTARTTVATESTIASTAKEITALASGAGFSAQAIVGLAGAMSSLAIPPERARGALSLYFGALNSAVAEGGPKLAAFAELTGKTADEIGRLVREGKGQEVFTSFISGLSQLDTVAKTSALKTLGLSTIRVDQSMRALAQNVPLLTKSLAGADAAFASNTELGLQYGLIQDTLTSKFTEFQNAVQNAAGAVGGQFDGALKDLLTAVTDVIVGFSAFANSPIGSAMLRIAGAVGAVLFAFLSLISAAALAKASLVVIPWALTGLGATTANNAVIRFIAGMVGMNLEVAQGAAGAEVLSSSMLKVGATSGVAAAGLRTAKIALAATGIGLAVILVSSLASAWQGVSEVTKLTADGVSGLSDAIKADTATWKDGGGAIATYSAKLPGTTEEQKKAAAASKHWADVLGTDLVGGANAASDAVSKIAAGSNVVETFRTALGADAGVKSIISDSAFSAQWTSLGLNMSDLIAEGLKSGGKESKIRDYLLKQLGDVSRVTTISPKGGSFTKIYDAQGKDITTFYNALMRLIPAIASTSTAMQGNANTSAVMESGINSATDAANSLSSGFMGATESLSVFQDNLQSGLKKFSSFSDIIKTLQGTGKEAIDPLKLDAGKFDSELQAANSRAVTFYQGIKALADGGRTEFATQLAEIGPDAQGILSSALKLSSGSQAQLEADARFAAFLSSDAFKTAYTKSMSTNFDAYAQIFKGSGNLSDVKSYIAASIAGTGQEWERQWDVKHPNLPLNVTPTLVDPTAADIEIYDKKLSGRITITPTINLDPRAKEADAPSNTYKDTLTRASITLPASLDGKALSDSLAFWSTHQKSTPQEIASTLNTAGFSPAVDAWRAKNGAITISAQLIPYIAPGSLSTIIRNKQFFREGGEVKDAPQFANGGSYGQFRGPGTGTSDSIWARVSAGEYISTKASTDFWGPDFFDSLNRKMLPTSFMNMLGSAVSGNQGPQSVTNVNVTQVNPLTRDPLKQLRESSEMVAAGIWGN